MKWKRTEIGKVADTYEICRQELRWTFTKMDSCKMVIMKLYIILSFLKVIFINLFIKIEISATLNLH